MLEAVARCLFPPSDFPSASSVNQQCGKKSHLDLGQAPVSAILTQLQFVSAITDCPFLHLAQTWAKTQTV